MVRGFEEEDAQEIIDEAEEEKNEEGYIKIKERGNNIKMNKKPEGRELVREAVSDLDKEINRIRRDRAALNFELKNIDDSLDNAQQLERRLKEKISRLDTKEAELAEKRKKLKQKSDILGKRLSKVRALKDQLSDV